MLADCRNPPTSKSLRIWGNFWVQLGSSLCDQLLLEVFLFFSSGLQSHLGQLWLACDIWGAIWSLGILMYFPFLNEELFRTARNLKITGLLVVEIPSDLAFHQLIHFQNEAHKENPGKKNKNLLGMGGLGGVPLQKSTHQKKHLHMGPIYWVPMTPFNVHLSVLGLYSLDPLDSAIFTNVMSCWWWWHPGWGVWAILNM